MIEKLCIALVGFFLGIFITCYFYSLDKIFKFEVTISQTQQNIIAFPNGTVFKKITEANEVLNDR